MGRADSIVPDGGDTATAPDPEDLVDVETVRAGLRMTNEPIRRPDVVRRDRLINELTAIADDVPLVLLTAPAGYGKSIVLRQWAAEDRRPFSWIRLNEHDRDPVHLLRQLVLALRRISPMDSAVWHALEPLDFVDIRVVLPRLITAAASISPPWVLVVDNVHELGGGPSAHALIAFAESLRAGCHLVVCGRHRRGLKLANLRSQGRCVEYGTRNLALALDEADVVLTAARLTATDPSGAELLRRTEGWPAGLYLATLAVAGGASTRPSTSTTSSGDQFVFDYLRENVLAGESAEMTEFLLRTAPLERMSGAFCDSVLGVSGSARRLAELAGRNVFVTSVDGRGVWYRHHPMFRGMLLAELRQRNPATETRIRRRAVAWCARQDLAEQAIGYAVAGGDTRTAARLVARYAQRYINSGQIHVVRGWLEQLGERAVADSPSLAVIAGWTWALAGDPARALECLNAAEHGLRLGSWRERPDGVPSDLRIAVISGIARLRAALAPNGVVPMVVDARTALDMEPPGGAWYPMAAMLFGVAQLLNGEPRAATEVLERAAHFGRKSQPATAAFALAQLSLLAAEQGDWVTAASCGGDATELISSAGLGEYPTSVAVYVAEVRVALHRRDYRRARALAGKALRLYADPSPAAFPWLAAQIAIELGGILLDLGNYPGARLKVTEARRQLARLPTGGVLRARHHRLAEDVAAHGARIRRSGEVMLTAAELRVLPLLPTHMTLSEIADALFISRNTVKTQVSSIYGKLLASSRAEAVRAARDLALVE